MPKTTDTHPAAVVPFRRRPRTPDEQLRALVLSECVDVTLSKGGDTRRYWIRPGKQLGEWYCQVWFGPDTQHRGETTRERLRVHRLQAEYDREITALEADGWRISAGVDPRPRT